MTHLKFETLDTPSLAEKIRTRTLRSGIIGLGYVGLTLGLILADTGFKVIGVDKVKSVIDRLNHKKSHIH